MQHTRKAKKDKTTKMTQRTKMNGSRYILLVLWVVSAFAPEV
jgi:hypothetical protein